MEELESACAFEGLIDGEEWDSNSERKRVTKVQQWKLVQHFVVRDRKSWDTKKQWTTWSAMQGLERMKIISKSCLRNIWGWMKWYWRGRKEGETKRFICWFNFSLTWGDVFAFVCFLACLLFFFFWGHGRDEGRIWRTGRWAELGCMIWNSQRVNEEVKFKRRKICTLLT